MPTNEARRLVQGLVVRIRTCRSAGRARSGAAGRRQARRQERATDYFRANAASWDHIRSLHASDGAVEAALLKLVGERPFQALLDLGTGTGRLLELFAPLYRRGVGIDMSREMLAVARANLDRAGVAHAQVRQGDIYAPPVERDAFDLVTMHQVLHYLDDPALAIREAARLLRPSGRLVIVDFAPHHAGIRARRACASCGSASPTARWPAWFAEAGLEARGDVKSIAPRSGVAGGLDREALARPRPAPADGRRWRGPYQRGDRLMNTFRFSRRPDIGDRIKVSFEFFPPKSDEMEGRLWQTVQRLGPLRPHFVSVTYGAGGSTRHRTARTVKRIIDEAGVMAAAHMTCVDATREEVDRVIADFAEMGVRRFVALRGDPAEGVGACYKPHPQGYGNAAELVAAMRRIGDFDISVSAYPEKHPESPDFATDIDMLKRKVDNGATRAITQFFFDNDLYERYVERVRRAGIYIPIVPGILPVHSFAQVANFSSRAGTLVPAWLAERFEGLAGDPQTHALVAAAVAAEQVMDLVERGVDEFHFYTMNRADLAFAVCHMIGIRPAAQATDSEAA
jgi:methylenetetrahydrofolate reductase (NADPH)